MVRVWICYESRDGEPLGELPENYPFTITFWNKESKDITDRIVAAFVWNQIEEEEEEVLNVNMYWGVESGILH